MKKHHTSIILTAAFVPMALITAQLVGQADSSKAPQNAVVPAADVEWGALNPARGKNGPRAANLWGDRASEGTTGFLVKFKDGFSSPPHIHNVTYRGIVISGEVHNDDPDAAEMWMPAGSYWTQPAGEVHITSAKGENVVAYIEIQSGPYLVLPAEKASDNGERPINVDPSNMVWLDSENTSWVDAAAKGAEITFLWGNPHSEDATAALVKLPAGFKGKIDSKGSPLRAVVVKGKVAQKLSGESELSSLEPGSYFGSEKEAFHEIQANGEGETLIYLRTEGNFVIESAGE